MDNNWSLIKLFYLSYFLVALAFSGFAQSNSWQPASDGINHIRSVTGRPPRLYQNGPNGRPWFIGTFTDNDSITRVAAYWDKQQWTPLPLKFSSSSFAFSMVKYGDTTYLGGGFEVIGHDSSSQSMSLITNLIKIHHDSIWFEDPWRLFWTEYWETQNDTLLALNTAYFGTVDTVEYIAMTDDGGQSWRYPFNPKHPTGTPADFNILVQARIHNGDIYITNNADSLGSPYRGVARWDGQQWHALGKGTPGFNSQVWALEFFQDDLYIGGSFNSQFFPDDPGVHFARWDGQKWHPSGNPVSTLVSHLIKNDTVLYAISRGDTFGDVRIPNVAAWDGSKWCGTPTNFNIAPVSMTPLKDTLLLLFNSPPLVNGVQMPQIIYFDGDYLNGPNSICSSQDLSQDLNLPSLENYKIFPNPVSRILNIESVNQHPINSIKLYSSHGALLKAWQFPDKSLHHEIEISDFSKGLYLIQVNNTYTERIRVN